LITLKAYELNQEKQLSLKNRHTSWDNFRHFINCSLTLNISLKTEEDIEAAVKFVNIFFSFKGNEEDTEAAVKFFNDTIQWAGWNAMPEHTDSLKTYSIEMGTNYEHLRTKYCLAQHHRNSNNSSITAKMIASKHSFKVLHQQNPLFPVEGDQENTCKAGQETFSTTKDITRNLGKKQLHKSRHFC
jgi:hypothetical protein